MPMNQMNISSAFPVFQKNPFRQFVLQRHIVIAVDFTESAPFLKRFQLLVYFAVNFFNSRQAAVFPQFFPISKLQIVKSFPEIMLKRGKIQMLIPKKVIRHISTASVTVAKDRIPAVFAEGQYGSVQKRMLDSAFTAHGEFDFSFQKNAGAAYAGSTMEAAHTGKASCPAF